MAVLLELEGRLHQFAGAAFGLDVTAGHRLAVVLLERRLRIEGVDGGQSAVHEEEDDALDSLRMIELGDAQAAIGERDRSRAGQRLAEHAGESHHAEAVANFAERFAASNWIS